MLHLQALGIFQIFACMYLLCNSNDTYASFELHSKHMAYEWVLKNLAVGHSNVLLMSHSHKKEDTSSFVVY